jgi:hypothetical protein
MTPRMVRTAVVSFLVLTGMAQAQQRSPSAPAELTTVLAVMRDRAATQAQKDTLLDKVYTAVVSVQAVRLAADPSAVSVWAVAVEPAPAGPAATVVRLIFEARADDDKVRQLRPNQQIRVRATLRSLSMDRSAASARFTDLVIEGGSK